MLNFCCQCILYPNVPSHIFDTIYERLIQLGFLIRKSQWIFICCKAFVPQIANWWTLVKPMLHVNGPCPAWHAYIANHSTMQEGSDLSRGIGCSQDILSSPLSVSQTVLPADVMFLLNQSITVWSWIILEPIRHHHMWFLNDSIFSFNEIEMKRNRCYCSRCWLMLWLGRTNIVKSSIQPASCSYHSMWTTVSSLLLRELHTFAFLIWIAWCHWHNDHRE